MKLALGISTVNKNILSLYDKIKDIPDDILIIICCQFHDESYTDERLASLKNICIVYKREKGLSKSRNVLLNEAYANEADYLIISDDDVCYDNEGLHKLHAYLNLPGNDSYHYQFQSCDENKVLRKNYKKNSFNIKIKDVFRVSSIEMCININEVMKDNIMFDEDFGLGTKYPAGEEPIFLSDTLKANHKIKFIPITITIHPLESSGMKLFTDEDALFARGAIFRRTAGTVYAPMFIFLFWLKKFCLERHNIRNKYSKLEALKIISRGYFYK